MLAKYTLTRSASERDLVRMSVFKSCPTKSMTGNGSKKDVADISEKIEENEGSYILRKLLYKYEIFITN